MNKLRRRDSNRSKELATALAIAFAIKASEVQEANAEPIQIINEGDTKSYHTEKSAHERIAILEEPIYGDLEVDQLNGIIKYRPDKFGHEDSFVYDLVGDRGAALGADGDWPILGLFVLGSVLKAVAGGGSSKESIPLDFGDALASFGTLVEDDGARHQLVNGLKLGHFVDSDGNGAPTILANGDDSLDFGEDDEDGVVVDSPMQVGIPASFNVTVAGNGYLNAWVDFDGDGVFKDDEHIISDLFLTDGTHNVTFNVPNAALSGETYARFRISSDPGLGPTGLAQDGEVEDYQFTILPSYDFGDAAFQTSLEQQGARHEINSDLRLGTLIDFEEDGQISADALADDDNGSASDDEDGLVYLESSSGLDVFTYGEGFTMQVLVNGVVESSAFLTVWLDLNDDGVFDSSERIYTNENVMNGVNTLSSIVLPDGDGVDITTVMRMRLYDTSMPNPLPTGLIVGGEVEDYEIEVKNRLDFGDLPFQTTLVDDGARHSHTSANLRLGNNKDFEGNGQPTDNANGDDNAGLSDDEDGLQSTNPSFGFTPLTMSSLANFSVIINGVEGDEAYLSAWIDFNDNNNFEASERVYTNVAVVNSPNFILPMIVLPDSTTGEDFTAAMRIRLYDTLIDDPQPTGLIVSGEVEDYIVQIVNRLDYGDAPFETTLLQNGAIHSIIPSGPILGQNIDDETNGQPSVNAQGDDVAGVPDDEDGISGIYSTFLSPGFFMYEDSFAYIDMFVSENAGVDPRVSAWIDFNNNGSFLDPGEEILNDVSVVDGAQQFLISIPDLDLSDSLNTYARFRIYDGADADASPVGKIAGGEVEDYSITIAHFVPEA